MNRTKNAHKQNSQKVYNHFSAGMEFYPLCIGKILATTTYMDVMGMFHWHGCENKHQQLELPYIIFVVNNTLNFIVLQLETFTKYLIV